MLLYDVKSSLFFTVSFEESYKSELQFDTDLQMCQVYVAVRFWNDKTGLAETKYFDSQFFRRSAAQNYLTVCTNLWVNLKRINCRNLQWMAPILIGMF